MHLPSSLIELPKQSLKWVLCTDGFHYFKAKDVTLSLTTPYIQCTCISYDILISFQAMFHCQIKM